MRKTLVIITGFLSTLPLLLWVSVIGLFLSNNIILKIPFNIIEILSLLNLVVLIYFIYALVKIETIGIGSKILWIIRFIITGFIAMPIFWYYFILHEKEYAKFTTDSKNK